MIRVVCPWPSCKAPMMIRKAGGHCPVCRVYVGPDYISRFAVSGVDSNRYPPPMPGPLTPPVARLLELVEADGRSRAEIAVAAGMSPAQLSQVLTGHRADPSITTVGRILAAIGKSWADLDPPKPKRRKA